MHGLPWTNPLKLQIASDEHIIDTTINRGLMMLLNNDYYLDMKNDLISKKLSSVIEGLDIVQNVLREHDSDLSKHFTSSVNTSHVYNDTYEFNHVVNLSTGLTEKLTKDTIKYLSIGWNASKIQKVIDETPHDLNGFTLMFLFVIPRGYVPLDTYQYILDIENDNINFNNFHHGTLIVMGDWLHKNDNFEKFTEKTDAQIDDPEKYDGLNVKKYLICYQNEIESPESIDDIIKFEADEKSFYGHEKTDFNKIIIKGSGINDNYSIVSFAGNTADVQVKNLAFVSSLKPNTLNPDEINLSFFTEKSLPPSENLIMLYPFKSDTLPEINENLENTIKNEQVEPIFSALSTYTISIDNNISRRCIRIT